MPAVPPTPRVKLRSTSRRIARQRAGGGVMAADPEPEMRLSRALLVMLLMHIVVIGGIVAFSLIKERPPGDPATPAAGGHAATISAASTRSVSPADAGALGPAIHIVRPGETLTRIANETGVSRDALVAANEPVNLANGLHAGQALKLPDHGATGTPRPSGAAADALALIEGTANIPPSPGDGTTRTAHLPADSGKTYVVGKGETPISIAHKLKVSYDALLKLNGIDDPKKLKPGQKLHVPAANKPLPKHVS
jgi:LysM repeat protein